MPQLQNITYSAVDFRKMAMTNLMILARTLQTTFEMISSSIFRASSPIRAFELADISAAFREAQLESHGRIIVRLGTKEKAPMIPLEKHPLRLDPN